MTVAGAGGNREWRPNPGRAGPASPVGPWTAQEVREAPFSAAGGYTPTEYAVALERQKARVTGLGFLGFLALCTGIVTWIVFGYYGQGLLGFFAFLVVFGGALAGLSSWRKRLEGHRISAERKR